MEGLGDEQIDALFPKFDDEDRRAIRRARTPDENEHAMMTAMLNTARGVIEEAKQGEEALLDTVFSDNGRRKYLALSARLLAASERPRGELNRDALDVVSSVCSNADLVKLRAGFSQVLLAAL